MTSGISQSARCDARRTYGDRGRISARALSYPCADLDSGFARLRRSSTGLVLYELALSLRCDLVQRSRKRKKEGKLQKIPSEERRLTFRPRLHVVSRS